MVRLKQKKKQNTVGSASTRVVEILTRLISGSCMCVYVYVLWS